ncbi:cholinesterase-like [Amblyomma americanum]
MLPTLFALSLLCCLALAAEHSAKASTSQGPLSGNIVNFNGKSVEEYLGIPYAQPPVGNLRFRKPVPLQSWNGTYDATKAKHSCHQNLYPVIFIIPTDLSEDCLYLNVWTPRKDGALKPVVVWIHGGAFKFGSSHERWYNGVALAALNDVVVVTLNYRLGIFGFLNAGNDEAPGNMGLWDQNAALKWIQRNIKAFGGDPRLVTLFGESAGSMSVHAHMLSPHSKGLFRRGFMMSGTLALNFPVESPSVNAERGKKVAQMLGCAAGPQDDLSTVLQCLRTKDAVELHKASEEAAQNKICTFFPTSESEFLPVLPSRASPKKDYEPLDTLISVTADEGAFAAIFQPDQRLLEQDLSQLDEAAVRKSYETLANIWSLGKAIPIGKAYIEKAAPHGKQAIRKALIDFSGDIYFRCQTMAFSEKHSEGGGKLYGFVFSYRSEKYEFPEFFGVPHTSDIPYYMGTPFLDVEKYTDKDRVMSRKAMDMLVSFARTGVPKHPGGLPWPPFSKKNPVYQWIQPGNYSHVNDLSAGRCQVIKAQL